MVAIRLGGGAAGLAASILLSRVLGPEGRGSVAALMAIMWLVRIGAGGGSQQAMVLRRADGWPAHRSLLLWSAGFGLLAAVAVAAWIAVVDPTSPGALSVRLAFVVATPIIVVTEWAIGLLVVLDRAATSAWFRIAPLLLRLAGYTFVLTMMDLSASSAQLLTIVAMCLPTLMVLYKYSDSLHGPRAEGRAVLTTFAAAHPSACARLLSRRIDQLILIALLDARMLGIYVAAASIAETPLEALQVLQPYAVLHSERVRRRPLAIVLLSTLVAGTAIAAVAGSLLSRLIVPVFGTNFEESAGPLVILLAATPALVVAQLGGAVLAGRGGDGIESVLQVGGVAVNVALLVVLTKGSAIGAAYASLFAYSLVAVLVIAVLLRGPRMCVFGKYGACLDP